MYTLPEDDATCGWNAVLEPPTEARHLEGEQRADCVIVGAGYTGLAAARRLAELRPDWRLVLLEAQRVGSGASGRNSGFVVDLVAATGKLGPEDQARYVRLAQAGIEELRDLVSHYRIECGWDETGWIRAAAGERGRKSIESLRPHLDTHGIAHTILAAEDLESITGSAFYRHGLRFPGYPLVQPAALVRGIAAALPAKVELYEESPVLSIGRDRPFYIRTPGGSVKAQRLLLATNGYTQALGFLQRQVFPLFAFGSVTRVLSSAEREALGGESSWGILGLDPMGSTLRRTEDQRLFIRSSVTHTKKLKVGENKLRWARGNHRLGLERRFPQLEEIELELTWSGLIGSTYNNQIHFGELRPGLFAAGGYTGAGIAMGTTAGRLLAELGAGERSSLLRDQQALPGPTSLPPDPFRSLGGRWIVRRRNAVASKYI